MSPERPLLLVPVIDRGAAAVAAANGVAGSGSNNGAKHVDEDDANGFMCFGCIARRNLNPGRSAMVNL